MDKKRGVEMDENFLGERLAKLRTEMGISARDMSLSLGQGENYINHLENGIHFCSWPTFLAICDYLHITPAEFFTTDEADPAEVREFLTKSRLLNAENREVVNKILDIALENQMLRDSNSDYTEK